MARIVVLGAGIGGFPAAYDLRHALGGEHSVTLINATPLFQFTPSNPWVAVGWRNSPQVSVPIDPAAQKKVSSSLPKRCNQLMPIATR